MDEADDIAGDDQSPTKEPARPTGYLWPGVLSAHVGWRQSDDTSDTALEVVATLGSPWLIGGRRRGLSKRAPRRNADAVFKAAQVMDWHVAHGLALPSFVLTALAVALGIEAHHRRLEALADALAMHVAGKTVAEIAEAVGFSEREIHKWRAADDYGQRLDVVRKLGRAPFAWFGHGDFGAADEAIAEARDVAMQYWGTDADRHPRPADAARLYGVVLWFTARDEPLPYPVWLATLCALGLADFEHGLLEVTIEALTGGVRFPEAAALVVKLDGEAELAGRPPLTLAAMVTELEWHLPRHMVPGVTAVDSYRKRPGATRNREAVKVYAKFNRRGQQS